MRILPTAAAAGIAALLLAGCGPAASKVTSPTLPPSTAAAVPSSSSAPTQAKPSTSSRGTIVKGLGQPAGFGTDAAHLVVTFTIDSIKADARCDDPNSPPTPPSNGHMVVAHMRLSTAPGADLSNALTSVNPVDFSFVGTNGITVPGQTITSAATYGCLKTAELFPRIQFAPGSNYVGDLVFDLPDVHGALIYNPGLTNASGWEWDF